MDEVLDKVGYRACISRNENISLASERDVWPKNRASPRVPNVNVPSYDMNDGTKVQRDAYTYQTHRGHPHLHRNLLRPAGAYFLYH